MSNYSDPYLEPDGIRHLNEFCLPYKYSSSPELKEGIDLSEVEESYIDYIIGYNHIWVDMTEADVNTTFLKRAFEYYNLDSGILPPVNFYNFLDFHYGRYKYNLTTWLDNTSRIFDNLDIDLNRNINKIPTLTSLQIKKLANDWVAQKRVELVKLKLKGETIEQQPPTVEAVEETTELDAELEMTAHKVVLLHELGVIKHLQGLRKEKYHRLTDTKFAALIGLILGLKGKKIDAIRKGISGYGQSTKDDPKTSKALQKVKSELLKFGIEL